jgi:hypothetical protein
MSNNQINESKILIHKLSQKLSNKDGVEIVLKSTKYLKENIDLNDIVKLKIKEKKKEVSIATNGYGPIKIDPENCLDDLEKFFLKNDVNFNNLNSKESNKFKEEMKCYLNEIFNGYENKNSNFLKINLKEKDFLFLEEELNLNVGSSFILQVYTFEKNYNFKVDIFNNYYIFKGKKFEYNVKNIDNLKFMIKTGVFAIFKNEIKKKFNENVPKIEEMTKYISILDILNV